jgi:hypothetical protein
MGDLQHRRILAPALQFGPYLGEPGASMIGGRRVVAIGETGAGTSSPRMPATIRL